jgi:two-component system, LuxR family, sensor kinase FixL
MQKRIIEVSEEERQRVGQDLHDSLGGHLTGVSLVAKALAQYLEGQPEPAPALALEVVEGLNQAISQTRVIAHGLCPVDQNEFGIISSLHEYAAELQRRSGVRCEVKVSGATPTLDPAVATHLFRIVQEAVNNALRHAKPNHLTISVANNEGNLSFGIWNNGKELDPGFARGQGLGLRTMKYRADLIGAQLHVGPAPGGGTLVSCSLAPEQWKSALPAPHAPIR